MKSSLFGLTLAVVAAFGVSSTPVTANEIGGWDIAGVHFANPFDSKTWYDGSNELELEMAEPVAINPTDPDFWMSIANPETHSVMHRAFLNPRSWAQFAKPETYVTMMDAKVWMKWAEPKTYSVLADPQTYAYRMQPGAFMHVFNAQSYAQLANPSAYMDIVSTAMETVGAADLFLATKAAIGPVLQ